MKKPQVVTDAGGKNRGLTITLEGTDSVIISKIAECIIKELATAGVDCLMEDKLQNIEENILVANQYLLDTSQAPLSPETLSLMAMVKYRERIRRSQEAKKNKKIVVGTTGWLRDAFYYELRGRGDVRDRIMMDFEAIRPDIWLAIDAPNSRFTKIATKAGVKVIPPDDTNKILSYLIEQINICLSNKPMPVQSQDSHRRYATKTSTLGAMHALCSSTDQLSVDLGTANNPTYYRPKNLGPKVLKAYDFINKKLLDNYILAVDVLKKHLATRAIHDKKRFKMGDVKNQALDTCVNLLPASTIVTVRGLNEIHIPKPTAISNQLGQKLNELFPNISAERPTPHVSLIACSPRNELDILQSVLFEHSNESLSSINNTLNSINYEKKSALLIDTLCDKSIPVGLSDVRYHLEIVGELGKLFTLLSAVHVDGVLLQNLTPRFGYDIPKIAEDAKLTELFEQSYDLGLELYSLLQSAGFETEAQYAVLLGHYSRYRLNLNYTQAKAIIGQSINSVSPEIKQQIATAHPIIWGI